MTTRARARADVVSRPLGGDEWALYDPVTDRVHALNVAAAVLWEHLDGRRDHAALAAVLAGHFPAAPADALAADVQAALERFHAEGLLEWV